MFGPLSQIFLLKQLSSGDNYNNRWINQQIVFQNAGKVHRFRLIVSNFAIAMIKE
jgi:hypothetical protein